MALLAILPPLDPVSAALIDALLLSVLLFPSLYLTAFRPLLKRIEQTHKDLDTRIHERTRELAAANHALRQERSFSTAVVETSGALIIALDREGRVVRFNQTCERITGYRADEVSGRVFPPLLIPPEDQKGVLEAFAKLRAGDFPSEHENHWLTRDNDRRLISWANTALLDPGGEVEYVIGTGLDITEHRQAEAALRESEERLRTILRTAQDGFWLVDAGGRLLDVNDAYSEMSGYSREELIGGHIGLLENVEDRGQIGRHLRTVLENGHDRFETQHRRKDGRIIDVEVSVTYLPTSGGQFFTFLRDVTARNRNAVESERRRAELEAIFNCNADAIVFTDTDRRIALTNPAFTTMFGYSPDEVNGKSTHFLDVQERPDFGDAHGPRSAANLGDPRPEPFEIQCRRKDGSLLWVETLAVPVLDVGANLLGHVGVHRDVSQRRQSETMIRASLREKEILLKEIHHRVKNNLQVIASLLNLQADQVQDAAAASPLLESRCRIHALSLIHEKLYRSPDLARVDFAEYLADLAESVITSANRSQTNITVAIDVGDEAFGIDAAIPISLIVNELIFNSVKHAFIDRPEGTIRVTLHRSEENSLLLAVEDDGIGLPADLDLRKSRTLGLQLVEVLAIQLGGTISVGRGKGARFEVSFEQPASELNDHSPDAIAVQA